MASEYTPGGSRILRHDTDPAQIPTHMSNGDHELLLAMERHLDKCYGRRERFVFHELFSPTIHVDVHVIAPSPEFPLVRLVTCGMAALPMSVPSDFAYSPYAELTIALPAHHSARTAWPLEVLQELARLPHDHRTYFWDGHTIPWGEPFAPDTKLSSVIILPPSEAPEDFDEFECRGNKVNILGVIPLHEDELQLCLNGGVDALYERFEAAGVTDVVDPARASVLTS